MQNVSGIYRLLAGLFILAVCSMVFLRVEGYAQFSDWRGVKVDYATNKYVANFYGSQSEYYRPAQMQGFIARINRGDTLRVGLDYYALSVSSSIVPQELLKARYSRLALGEVFVYRVYRDGRRVVWVED